MKLLSIMVLLSCSLSLSAMEEAGRLPFDEETCQALYKNLSKNRVDEVSAIVEKYPSIVNAPISFWRAPLHVAAEYTGRAMITLLINKGANIEVKDRYDYTPLLIAIKERNQEAFDTLMDHKPNISVRDVVDELTPLGHAIEEKNVHMVRKLLQAGASRDELVKNCYEIGFRPQKPLTIARYIELYGQNEEIKKLLRESYQSTLPDQVNTNNNNNATPALIEFSPASSARVDSGLYQLLCGFIQTVGQEGYDKEVEQTNKLLETLDLETHDDIQDADSE